LVSEAVRRRIPVVPIPGANAALSALIVSGLPTDRFLFAGFPPRDRKGLKQFLEELRAETGTIILYEAPHRLLKTLQAMSEPWGSRQAAVVRELTKRHEEVVRGSIRSLCAHLEEHPPLGECCIIIEGTPSNGEAAGANGEQGAEAWWAELTTADHVERYEGEGHNRKEAMRLAARDRGCSRRDIYQALLRGSEN
jgi:16S rRNA (cytidine1402-2'-O)-methyltransferase